jgi:hypothetical protein
MLELYQYLSASPYHPICLTIIYYQSLWYCFHVSSSHCLLHKALTVVGSCLHKMDSVKGAAFTKWIL